MFNQQKTNFYYANCENNDLFSTIPPGFVQPFEENYRSSLFDNFNAQNSEPYADSYTTDPFPTNDWDQYPQTYTEPVSVASTDLLKSLVELFTVINKNLDSQEAITSFSSYDFTPPVQTTVWSSNASDSSFASDRNYNNQNNFEMLPFADSHNSSLEKTEPLENNKIFVNLEEEIPESKVENQNELYGQVKILKRENNSGKSIKKLKKYFPSNFGRRIKDKNSKSNLNKTPNSKFVDPVEADLTNLNPASKTIDSSSKEIKTVLPNHKVRQSRKPDDFDKIEVLESIELTQSDYLKEINSTFPSDTPSENFSIQTNLDDSNVRENTTPKQVGKPSKMSNLCAIDNLDNQQSGQRKSNPFDASRDVFAFSAVNPTQKIYKARIFYNSEFKGNRKRVKFPRPVRNFQKSYNTRIIYNSARKKVRKPNVDSVLPSKTSENPQVFKNSCSELNEKRLNTKKNSISKIGFNSKKSVRARRKSKPRISRKKSEKLKVRKSKNNSRKKLSKLKKLKTLNFEIIINSEPQENAKRPLKRKAVKSLKYNFKRIKKTVESNEGFAFKPVTSRYKENDVNLEKQPAFVNDEPNNYFSDSDRGKEIGNNNELHKFTNSNTGNVVRLANLSSNQTRIKIPIQSFENSKNIIKNNLAYCKAILNKKFSKLFLF